LAKKSWCVTKLTDEFRERMEDVLTLYEQPHRPSEPVVCLDEQPFQLLDDVRRPTAAAPGQTNWAVKAVRDAAPAGRETLAVLGREVFGGISAPSDPLGVANLQTVVSTPTGNAELLEAIRACFPSNESQLQSAFDVFEWLKGI
jgi:hypothetical protein